MVKKRETIQETDKEDVLLYLKVTPNAPNFEIKGVNPWTGRLEIKLSSPARKGKANEELIKTLEEHLGKEVRITRGMKSRKKILLVKDCTKQELKKHLGIAS